LQLPRKASLPSLLETEKAKRVHLAPIVSHEFCCADAAAIGALHFATVLPSHSSTSGTKVLSKRKIVKAWQRDVVTRSRYPVQYPYFDVFTPEIPPDVSDIRNVSADGI